jgi:hypothetical protein
MAGAKDCSNLAHRINPLKSRKSGKPPEILKPREFLYRKPVFKHLIIV